MVRRNQHLILRQILELDVTSIARAPEVQEAVAQQMREVAITKLETLFDRLSPPDRLVRLERIEIDLGELVGADWQQQFQARLLAKLAESLEHASVDQQWPSITVSAGHNKDFEQYLFFLQHGRLPWWGETPPAHWPRSLLRELDTARWQVLATVLACDAHARQRLIHGVDDTILSSLLERHTELCELLRVLALWHPVGLPAVKHTVWRNRFWLTILECVEISGQIRHGTELMERLLQLRVTFEALAPTDSEGKHVKHTLPDLPTPWQEWLGATLSDSNMSRSAPFADVTTVLEHTDTRLERTDTRREMKRGEELAEQRQFPDPAAFDVPEPTELNGAHVKQAAPGLSAPEQGWPETSRTGSAASHTTPFLDDNPAASIFNSTHGQGSGANFISTPAESGEASAVPSAPNRSPPRIEDAVELPADRPTSAPPPPSARVDVTNTRTPDALVIADEAIYLNGAGCVILHPFLEELFRSNDLLEGRNFRDEVARTRAVHLLALLTFGNETTPEYELLLPKLLCGMAWEEVLEPVELTDEERAACDELLQAILKHWRALKSSSTEWLREQFFLRAAKLEKLDWNWRLTVERRAQDVLLDRLPWGLGVVGLPWRQGRIFVHWIQ